MGVVAANQKWRFRMRARWTLLRVDEMRCKKSLLLRRRRGFRAALACSLTTPFPLQKYFYRFSKSRGKADYFEGRDDSGVVSARFVEEAGGTTEFRDFYRNEPSTEAERGAYTRFLENCWAMGAAHRPDTTDPAWRAWYGTENAARTLDRCRVLLAINTVGAGRGSTMLWETTPPLPRAELPQPWISEQETAVTHLERNLQEINAMCETGLVAARVQVLVCEPIPAKWTEWMDAQLPACGGKAFDPSSTNVEDRPSPVQIVVAASPTTADECHNLKSGFMEKRAQDLLFAAPQEGQTNSAGKNTSPDLVSSDDHDVYISLKWTTLVTMRSLHSFLQASADVAAGASAETAAALPTSPFLIPSFVRMSYVSEENSKVAKWRMHGDFFHPAAWEICKDSFDVTWIPSSLSGSGGVKSVCTDAASKQTARRLSSDSTCGQWWIYFTELQMPTSPEVYATEESPAPVQGGSTFFWMATERQRVEIVKGITCRQHNAASSCPEPPQAVIPLGDLESFLINFTPNTALGKKHVKSRRPGYSNEDEREKDRARVKERKQLNEQEDIEKALFDYTIYPAALFHKDATLKAARAVDAQVTGDTDQVGPQSVKSSYYDVTITKPRPPVLGWCQAVARNGLCTLYQDYFRMGSDRRCDEACGMSKGWTKVEQ